MTTPPADAEDFGRVFGNAFRDIVGAADQMLSDFAAGQAARAESLASAHELLKGSLGEDHPRVKALEAAVAAARGVRDQITAVTNRRAKEPTVNPHEWIVSGRVRSATGEPAVGLRVRLFDQDRTRDDLLGDTRTDEQGDFRAVYHERDFAEPGEGQPELYVRVENAAGDVLYTSRDELRIHPGRVEYFDIVLPEAGAAPPRAAAKPPRSPARTKRPKGEG